MNLTVTSPAVAAAPNQPLPENLEGACRALEKVFAQMVFQKMREAMVPDNAGGAAGFARTSAEGMLNSQWAELASQGEGLGLWRALYRQLQSEPVKSAGAESDQEPRGTTHRTEADYDAQGSAGTLGPRLGNSRPAASAAAYPRVSRLPSSQGFGVAGTMAEDHSR